MMHRVWMNSQMTLQIVAAILVGGLIAGVIAYTLRD